MKKKMNMKLPVILASVAVLAAGCETHERHHARASANTGASSGVYESAATQGSASRTMQSDNTKSTDASVNTGVSTGTGTSTSTEVSSTTGTSGTAAASADADFIKQAAQSGLAEVQIGKLAEQKAQNQAVKDFGKQLVSDHQKANQELMSLAAQKGVQVPTQVGLDDTQTINQLNTASGADFDRLAVKENVKAHQKVIDQFKAAQNKVQDPQLKAFITKTLPELESHLQHAQQLESSITAVGGSENIEGQAAPVTPQLNENATPPANDVPGSPPMDQSNPDNTK